jgi:hypothetical protein
VPSFIDEVFDPFYMAASKKPADYSFGQIFTVPAYYPHQKLDIWRPKTLDATLGIASDFNIITAGNDAFRRLAPYSSPPLKSNEEFIALKAKPRPVILLQPPDPSLLEIKTAGYSAKVVRHLCPVALIYSAEDEAGNSKFAPDFLNRVRRLEYGQFLFLPQGNPMHVDSIARLDEIQSVAENQLSATGFSLCEDVREILRSQVSFFLTGLSGVEFAGWAALLKE